VHHDFDLHAEANTLGKVEFKRTLRRSPDGAQRNPGTAC
jgi:hypothetical protein